LEDFVWGGICLPQVSKRAVELLADEGISLTTGQIELRYRGQKVESHVSVQFDTVRILEDTCLKRFDVIQCDVCKYWRKVQQRGYPLTGYLVRKDLWPNGGHLVQPLEGGREMVSPEFMEAVRKHGLTGIEFVECGEYV